jgi:flagellar basal body P-ring protein FlgI
MLAVIMVAVNEKNQRLGDLIAGTVLVKTKARTQLKQTIYRQLPTDYQVSYPEAINLKDSDFELIKEVVLMVKKTGNSTLALQAQQKIEQTLHIMSKQTEPIIFLQVILSDYYYMTSQLQAQ